MGDIHPPGARLLAVRGEELRFDFFRLLLLRMHQRRLGLCAGGQVRERVVAALLKREGTERDIARAL